MMTLGSLFDGAGGFPLAGTMAGITPLWASEIEPFPIRVTTRRFPNMKHLGSITAINGGEIEPVDIVTFGSPCQDLSVAGRRRGLSGERSGLFLEAIRIIKEMREKTHGRKPRYIVWENVPGAFSSNAGRDFQAVLTEIIRIAEPNAPDVPLPDKRWPMADLYGGNGWSLAYRVYDAQFWGVPQRRKRIYLVADFGGNRAGKIQFECDRLYGDSPQGAGAGEETAGTAGKHLEESGRAVCLNDQGGSRMEISEGIAGTLRSEMHGHPPMVAFHLTQDPITDEEKSPCIGTGNPTGGQATVGVMLPAAYGLSSRASNAWQSPNPDSGCYPARVARTLNTNGGDATCNQGGNLIVCKAKVFENHGQDTRFKDSGDIAQTVVATYGTGGGWGTTAPSMQGWTNTANRPTSHTKNTNAVFVDGSPSSTKITARNAVQRWTKGRKAMIDDFDGAEILHCPYCGRAQDTHEDDEISANCCLTECEHCGKSFWYSVEVTRAYWPRKDEGGEP